MWGEEGAVGKRGAGADRTSATSGGAAVVRCGYGGAASSYGWPASVSPTGAARGARPFPPPGWPPCARRLVSPRARAARVRACHPPKRHRQARLRGAGPARVSPRGPPLGAPPPRAPLPPRPLAHNPPFDRAPTSTEQIPLCASAGGRRKDGRQGRDPAGLHADWDKPRGHPYSAAAGPSPRVHCRRKG